MFDKGIHSIWKVTNKAMFGFKEFHVKKKKIMRLGRLVGLLLALLKWLHTLMALSRIQVDVVGPVVK